MRFQLAASVLGMVSLVAASASALPLLHRHHRTYVIESPQTNYVAPPPVAPQVNVQVSPQEGPRGGGPDSLRDHQLQEQQDLQQHQFQEQQQLREHQMQENAPQY